MANESELESAIPLAQDSAASMDGGQLGSAAHVVLKLLVKAAGADEHSKRPNSFRRNFTLPEIASVN